MTEYYGNKKSKLITLRINPEVHKKIVVMVGQYNAAKGYWHYSKKTVSKMLCMAIEDFINGNQEQRKDFDETVKTKKKKR